MTTRRVQCPITRIYVASGESTAPTFCITVRNNSETSTLFEFTPDEARRIVETWAPYFSGHEIGDVG